MGLRLKNLTLLSLYVVLGSWLSHAQTGTPAILVPDEPVMVTLQAEAPIILTYNAQAGDIINISARAVIPDDMDGDDAPQIPDTVLTVYDAQYIELAYNDDTHHINDDGSVTIQRDAQINNLRLPTDGVVSIHVDSFNGVSTGDVVVLLTQADPYQLAEDMRDDGVIVSGFIPAGDSVTYHHTIPDSADTVMLQITVRDMSGTFDPLLAVYDGNGQQLAMNDDHASHDLMLNVLDARIDNLPVEAGQTLTVHIGSFTGADGAFELTILYGPSASTSSLTSP